MKDYPGFTINDILDTDYEMLMSTLNANEAEQEYGEEEVTSLADFIRSI